jgi:hypothetical protein
MSKYIVKAMYLETRTKINGGSNKQGGIQRCLIIYNGGSNKQGQKLVEVLTKMMNT